MPSTDDSEWIILTLIRMYEATECRNTSTPLARPTRETVIARWTEDENSGGIRWSFDAENSKNACSNGPGASTPCLWAAWPQKGAGGISIWPMRRFTAQLDALTSIGGAVSTT